MKCALNQLIVHIVKLAISFPIRAKRLCYAFNIDVLNFLPQYTTEEHRHLGRNLDSHFFSVVVEDNRRICRNGLVCKTLLIIENIFRTRSSL